MTGTAGASPISSTCWCSALHPLAAAFAPNMTILIICRFIMGVGLGAENVVGYSTMTEFVPARSRGKWLGLMAVCVVTGLPISLLVASIVVPMFGWRAMFIIGGIGALIRLVSAQKTCPSLRAGSNPSDARTRLRS